MQSGGYFLVDLTPELALTIPTQWTGGTNRYLQVIWSRFKDFRKFTDRYGRICVTLSQINKETRKYHKLELARVMIPHNLPEHYPDFVYSRSFEMNQQQQGSSW